MESFDGVCARSRFNWCIAGLFFVVMFFHEQHWTVQWTWSNMPESFTTRQIVAEIWAAAWLVLTMFSAGVVTILRAIWKKP